jgi:hypothetical protein
MVARCCGKGRFGRRGEPSGLMARFNQTAAAHHGAPSPVSSAPFAGAGGRQFSNSFSFLAGVNFGTFEAGI